MLTISTAERRARIGRRHRLAAQHRADEVIDVVRDLVCLHASDPATVYLSAWSRSREPSRASVEALLYEDRTALRMLAMRRTMFIVDVEEAPVLHAAASAGLVRRERARNEQLVGMLGIKDTRRWLRGAERATLEELHDRGEATASELSSAIPALRRKVRLNVGKRYEADIGLAGRILIVLALEGRIVRGRPRGSWVSSQYRWAAMDRWIGTPLPELDAGPARARLIARWLARFGPGTEADIRWWTGLTARQVRTALVSVGAVEVDLDGMTGYLLPDDLDALPAGEPWVALLPSLDGTTMGWQSRAWYLGQHQAALFDTNGNAGPTVWCDGRIVGGWAIRPGGEVVTRLLEDVGADAHAAIAVEAARLSELIDGVQVTPRFPTPLQQALLSERD